MSDNTKTPEELAKLNQFRQVGGKFGERDHTDPDPDQELALGNAYRDASSPLTVKVGLERWDERDNAVEVGVVEFDARAIFDSHDLTYITDAEGQGDLDWVFDTARAHGLVEDHGGPFTVGLPDDFQDYIEHRENNGMTEAYESAPQMLAISTMEKRQEVLAEAERLLGIAGEHATFDKVSSELAPGDVLVQGEYRLPVDAVRATGDGRRIIETPFGELQVPVGVKVTVEAG